MKHIKCLIICFLFINLNSTAQIDYIQFDQLNNGLSTNIVNCIYQDKKGWMWFSTSQGLNQYDGNKIKNYKLNSNTKNSLIGNLIRFIYEDSKNQLWIGTEVGGLNLYNRETDNFTYFPDVDADYNIIKFSANSLAEDKKGFLWIGTNKGLKKFDKKSCKFTTYLRNDLNANSLDDNFIKKVLFDNFGKLWVGTNSGLNLFNPATRQVERINLFPPNIADHTVFEIFKDTEGKMWIGTYANGIYIFDPVSKSFEHLLFDKNNEFSKTSRAIIQDGGGNFWVGTKNGLYIYSPKTKNFSHFEKNEKNPLSLCHNSILSIFRDNKGDVWIGTRGGISYLINEKQVFRHFHSFPDDNQYLNNSDVYSFWLDNKNNIWVGTDFGGINVLDNRKKTFSYLTTNSKSGASISNNSVKCMSEDGKGNLWIGTFQGGITVYNLKYGTTKFLNNQSNNQNSLIDNRVWSIVRDHNGDMWIGTARGVDFFDANSQKFIHKKITEKQVDWIAEDSENNMWIGTNSEINIYNTKNTSLKKLSVNTRTRGFCEDHLNQIWLTTETQGIILIDKQDGKILKSIGEEHGLASNSTFSIIEDNQEALWIGTANGLSRFIPKSNKIRNFYKEDGTQITHYNYGACYKMPSGELLFGGFNGFVLFDPKKVKENEYLPPVVLTDFKINGETVNCSEENSPLQKHITETQNITLRHDQNFLSFEYVALNYCTPNNNRYKYKMEGVDKNWIDAGNNRNAIYTNLQPGTYTFNVIASNNDNQWNETGTSLRIKIIPPFYKTLLFKILFIIFIVLAILYLIYLRTNRVQILNKELERQVRKKTNDLQQVAVQLEESQAEVMSQNEEIEKQNEFLKELNEKISLQNRALETYSNDLEIKVSERTTELEHAKTKAEESDKLKSAILANMSHEIRTPMNSIMGLTTILLTDEISDEDKSFFTQNIRKNCDALLHLINGVLDLSAIEAGKLALNNTPVNIAQLLQDIYHAFDNDKQWLEKNHIDFKLKLPADDLLVNTDHVRVEQILRNLLHNAFKFTENGYVELGFATSVNDIILYVKDTGIGIPLTKQNLIFDSFVKLEENTSKGKGDGVGLGLSICWRLTHLLGGKLWVVSDLQEGSTFYFSLPMNGYNK